jgi:hypothetical protein
MKNKFKLDKSLFQLPYEEQFTSQNGEDGIIKHLIQYTKKKNFVEIGWGKGVTNNCRNLVENLNFTGSTIDMKEPKIKYKQVNHVIKKLKPGDGQFIIDLEGKSPGLFSIDIDSFDYWLLKELIELDFRPDILIHEYNSVLGPEAKIARKYPGPFDKKVNYGASLKAYKSLLSNNYTFITVDSIGINAFYIRNDIDFKMPEKRLDFQYIQRGDKDLLMTYKMNDKNWVNL